MNRDDPEPAQNPHAEGPSKSAKFGDKIFIGVGGFLVSAVIGGLLGFAPSVIAESGSVRDLYLERFTEVGEFLWFTFKYKTIPLEAISFHFAFGLIGMALGPITATYLYFEFKPDNDSPKGKGGAQSC